ncbi:MAG: HAMP domain-containing sensor histidine kinase [Bacteroidota bacterium]|nr:HAMP domain-containing sensor histidine kinase [Bacteroidota bacterium]
MKNKLLYIWKKISENGISDDIDNAEKKRIRVLNRIIFINALLSFTFLIIDIANYSFASNFVAISISFTTFAFSPILFLVIMKKYYQVAKWSVIFIFVFFISFVAILTGKDSGIILFFIPGILFPTILFQRKKTILVLTILIIGVLIAVFVINQIYNPQLITNQSELSYYFISNLIGCAIITLLVIWYFKSTNSEYEKIIIEKNNSLNNYNLELSQQKLKLEEKNIENEQLLVNLESIVEERTLKLQKTKNELADINLSLEKKVLEKTKKNIDLSRSILEQEKLVTIGELSAGIAHDLNTPLGVIRVGSDNVSFILDKLFRVNLRNFSRDELIEILDYVKRNKIEKYIGGLRIRKEKEDMTSFLMDKYAALSTDNIKLYADLLVKCRIGISQEELIKQMIERPNGLEYLDVLSQVQMAMAQLETIKASSDKAVRVVQDLRAYIKGEGPLEKNMVNLHENISTVLGVFNYEINLNVDLKYEVHESIEFMGYDIKLFQLWSNIVKNALEAMADQKDRYLGVFAERKKNRLKVVFENNGPKIPDEIIDTIFNKFYTTKAKKSGSGLGLSIVKNVLREHQADINIESSESLTKFIITFDL